MSIDTPIEYQQARFLKCIGEPTRIRIIKLLSAGEKCVGDICRETTKDQPLVSHHLRSLRECGIVTTRQESQKVYYQLMDPALARLVALSEELVSELALCQAAEVSLEMTADLRRRANSVGLSEG